jgi:hypothetical protein
MWDALSRKAASYRSASCADMDLREEKERIARRPRG